MKNLIYFIALTLICSCKSAELADGVYHANPYLSKDKGYKSITNLYLLGELSKDSLIVSNYNDGYISIIGAYEIDRLCKIRSVEGAFKIRIEGINIEFIRMDANKYLAEDSAFEKILFKEKYYTRTKDSLISDNGFNVHANFHVFGNYPVIMIESKKSEIYKLLVPVMVDSEIIEWELWGNGDVTKDRIKISSPLEIIKNK
jgi:hypothetical protein